MAYVDAFVMPVLARREADYRKWAEIACTVWIEYGALAYSECRAEDVPEGPLIIGRRGGDRAISRVGAWYSPQMVIAGRKAGAVVTRP